MRDRILIFGGVMAGILAALWFSTVVALGPAPGSIGPQPKGTDRQGDQNTAQHGPAKQQKQQSTEEEKYCGGSQEHYL